MKLAQFTLKPSNRASDIDLEDLVLTLKGTNFASPATAIDIDSTSSIADLNKNLKVKV
jgi:hypothetical protein